MSKPSRRRGMQILLESLLGMGLFAAVVLLILVYLPTSDRAALVTDQTTQPTWGFCVRVDPKLEFLDTCR